MLRDKHLCTATVYVPTSFRCPSRTSLSRRARFNASLVATSSSRWDESLVSDWEIIFWLKQQNKIISVISFILTMCAVELFCHISLDNSMSFSMWYSFLHVTSICVFMTSPSSSIGVIKCHNSYSLAPVCIFFLLSADLWIKSCHHQSVHAFIYNVVIPGTSQQWSCEFKHCCMTVIPLLFHCKWSYFYYNVYKLCGLPCSKQFIPSYQSNYSIIDPEVLHKT